MKHVLDLLQKNSPFICDSPIIGTGNIIFMENEFSIGDTTYQIKEIYETDDLINIIPSNLVFEYNIQVDIDYPKPIYILYNKDFLDYRGFIHLKKK